MVVHSFNDKEQKIFNNAGQAWNHIIYWEQMKPGGESNPTGKLHSMIEDAFGGFDSFKDQFIQQSVGVFGSGWCWLAQNNDKLEKDNEYKNRKRTVAFDKKIIVRLTTVTLTSTLKIEKAKGAVI